MPKKPLFFLIPLMMLFSSCQKSSVPAQAASTAQVEVQPVPQIIFVNLEIAEDSLTQAKSVTLLNSTVTRGRLKGQVEGDTAGQPGDIQCSFLSASGQVLHTVSVPDPLQRTYEYASEDGKLEKKTIKLKKAIFSLRAPLEPGTTQLLVQQRQDNRQLKELQTLDLSL